MVNSAMSVSENAGTQYSDRWPRSPGVTSAHVQETDCNLSPDPVLQNILQI